MKELMKAVEETFIDEVKDFNERINVIYCGCVVEHYYFPEGNEVIYDHSIIHYGDRQIKCDLSNWNRVIKVCEEHLAHYPSMAYDSKVDIERGK